MSPSAGTASGHFEPGWSLMQAVLPPWLKVWFRWSFEGLEHIPVTGPAIVAANHLSYLDAFAVAFGLHKAGRRARFLAKSELFEVPMLKTLLRSAGQIPVHRGTRAAPHSLTHAEEALGRGEVVVVFPEGTTTTDPDLKFLRPKSGCARLALRTGIDVIPCATWGGQWFWTKHLPVRLAPGKEVWVRFGPPIRVGPYRDRAEDRSAWNDLSEQVMEEIGVLLAGLRAAKPWVPTEPIRKRYLRKQQERSARIRAAAAERGKR